MRSETAYNHVECICVLKARDKGSNERMAGHSRKDIAFVPDLFIVSLLYPHWLLRSLIYSHALLASV